MKIREMDELIFLWKAYGKERDSKLTPDAQGLKRNIRVFVKSLPKYEDYEEEARKKQ